MTRVAWLVALLATARAARADVPPEDAAKAVQLFDEGRKLLEAGQLDRACDMFAGSLKLDPEVGTKLNLADCRERQGQLAVAYRLFAEAEAEAAKTGKAGREKFAREHREALAAKTCRVTLHVAEPDRAGLVIELHAHALPRDAWAEQQVLEPGPLAVDATAPGRVAFHADLVATAGGLLEVQIPALAVVAEHPQQSVEPVVPSRSWTPYYVAGGGGALLVGSVALGLYAKSRYNDALTVAEPAKNERIHSAQTEANIATGIAIAGGVAVAAAVALYVRSHHGVVIAPTAGTASIGLAIAGSL
ncbi:MAG TPA: hypothetical protein VMJ10_05340 [Kofleriaceae bacterium]|nr:hypothetical protein [Kofleriaceae bacterium]